jgi:hypothetical protein
MSIRVLFLAAICLSACSAGGSAFNVAPADATAPDAIPGAAPGAAPDATTAGVVEDATAPGVAPDAPIPDAAPGIAPDAAVPDTAPDVTAPDASPDTAPDATAPDATAPDAAPDFGPDSSPDGAPTDLALIPPDLVNVAAGGTASASAIWQDDPRVYPDEVIDGSLYDAVNGGNYWLLPNETPGWWQVDLNRTFDIELVRILNCNNGRANDRATKDFRLEIRDDAGTVVYSAAGILPFTSASSASNPTRPYDVRLEKPVAGRTVRIFVDSWYPTRTDPTWPYPVIDSSDDHNQGGGLDEVQVFANVRR